MVNEVLTTQDRQEIWSLIHTLPMLRPGPMIAPLPLTVRPLLSPRRSSVKIDRSRGNIRFVPTAKYDVPDIRSSKSGRMIAPLRPGPTQPIRNCRPFNARGVCTSTGRRLKTKRNQPRRIGKEALAKAERDRPGLGSEKAEACPTSTLSNGNLRLSASLKWPRRRH